MTTNQSLKLFEEMIKRELSYTITYTPWNKPRIAYLKFQLKNLKQFKRTVKIFNK
jgi:hypothetical protein